MRKYMFVRKWPKKKFLKGFVLSILYKLINFLTYSKFLIGWSLSQIIQSKLREIKVKIDFLILCWTFRVIFLNAF